MLGIESRSSGSAASALNHFLAAPPPRWILFEKEISIVPLFHLSFSPGWEAHCCLRIVGLASGQDCQNLRITDVAVKENAMQEFLGCVRRAACEQATWGRQSGSVGRSRRINEPLPYLLTTLLCWGSTQTLV